MGKKGRRRRLSADFEIVLVLAALVVVSIVVLVLGRRLAATRRQLEEERAYNEYADAKIGQLVTDGVMLVDKLAEKTRQCEKLQALYVQYTRALLAQNFAIIDCNVHWKGKVDHE